MSYLPCNDPALFAYLAWNTRPNQAILGCDETRQAAYLAIIKRTRTQFCHVLAIGGSADKVHLVVEFPPSLSVSTVARMAQDAGGKAIAYYSEVFHGSPVCHETLWETGYTVHTMGRADAANAQAYLHRQMSAGMACLPLSDK